MRTRPVEDRRHLFPVTDIFKRHLFYRSAGNDHSVVIIFLYIVEVFIKLLHMFDRSILWGMALYLHKVQLHLQRGITQQTDQVCLCRDLQRHQVQHYDT